MQALTRRTGLVIEQSIIDIKDRTLNFKIYQVANSTIDFMIATVSSAVWLEESIL